MSNYLKSWQCRKPYTDRLNYKHLRQNKHTGLVGFFDNRLVNQSEEGLFRSSKAS